MSSTLLPRLPLAVTLAAAFATAPALAIITGVTGQAVQISPPASVVAGTYYTSMADYTTVWDEQQGVLASGVAVDMANNPASDATAIAGFVSGVVDSHFIYFRHFSSPSVGTVTFDNKIVGMAYSGGNLYASDAQFQPSGTTYSGTRGCLPGADQFSINGNTLSFNLFGFLDDTAEIRVFTAVPAPGSLALLGLGGLAAARRRRA